MRSPNFATSLILQLCLALPIQFVLPSQNSAAANPPEFSIATVRDHCIEFTKVKKGDQIDDYRDCAVSNFAKFGAADGQTYYYALYCLVSNAAQEGTKCGQDSFDSRYYENRGVAIFTQDRPDGDLQILFERAEPDIGTLRYEKPEIIENPADTLLYIPIAIDGTGAGNESEYYLREKGEWKPIEAKEWLTELQQRIPQGLQIWKGIWPDLHTLRAEAGLYREKDANCCPTGGVARIQLEIRAGQFVIGSISFESEQ
jgi:hypothetical protein